MDTMDKDGRLKAEGEVEVFDLGELSGIEALNGSQVGLRHHGAIMVNRWNRGLQALRLSEARGTTRIMREEDAETLEAVYGPARDALEARRQKTVADLREAGEDVPEMVDSPVTLRRVIKPPEADEAFNEFARECVGECVASLRTPNISFTPELQGPSPAEDIWSLAVVEIERLGCLQVVFNKSMEVQRLGVEGFSSTPSAGGNGVGEDPAPVAGAGDDR